MGERTNLALNTEPMIDENSELILGNDIDPNYIETYYLDGMGFAHNPMNTFSPKNEYNSLNPWEKVFVQYYQHSDTWMDHPIDSVKIFNTQTILDAKLTGGDINDNSGNPAQDVATRLGISKNYEQLITRQDFLCSFVEIPSSLPHGGKYFANTYINYYIDNSNASTIGWIYDPEADTWERVDGTLHIPESITGVTGRLTGSFGDSWWHPVVFTGNGMFIDDDGDGVKETMIATVYGGGCHLIQSTDLGLTWTLRSVIFDRKDSNKYYNPNGTPISGFVEPSLTLCADGSLLSILRVGNNLPLWQTRSFDNGLTWTEPEIMPGGTNAMSIYPGAVLLDNGVLVACTGRPNTTVVFSLDGCGYKWDYLTTVYDDAANRQRESTGNSSITQIGSNMAFITGDYGFAENRPSGIWGRVIEVTRNEVLSPKITEAVLKASSDRFELGGTLSLYFSGIFDSNGRLIDVDDCDVKFYSESPEILSVNENTGVVSALSYGTANVVAALTYQGVTVLSNTVEITAIDVERLDHVTLAPEDWTLDVGQIQSVNAIARNKNGTQLVQDVSFSYFSDDPSIATVDSNGMITGVAPGYTKIWSTATKNGVSKTASTIILVNSPLWEVADFENGTVGNNLGATDYSPHFTINVPNSQKPKYSDAYATSGSQSLHFLDDDSTNPPGVGANTPALRREYSGRQAVVVEFMLRPVNAQNGIYFGIGDGVGHTGASVCWIRLLNPAKEPEVAVGSFSAGAWLSYGNFGIAVNEWHKVRIEACTDKPAKLYIDDRFITEIKVCVPRTNLTNFTAYGGVNSNELSKKDEMYLDDLKVMTFDMSMGDDNKLTDLRFDGETIQGFDPDVFIYNITLPKEKMGRSFEAIPANPANDVIIDYIDDAVVTCTVRGGVIDQVYRVNITWQNPTAPPIMIPPVVTTPEDLEVETGEDGNVTIKAKELAKAKSLEIKGEANITVSKEVLASIGTDEDLTVSVKKVQTDDLSLSNKLLVGNRPVFEFKFKAGEKTISEFGGEITIAIPYELAENEKPEHIRIYYIDDEGNATRVENAYYDEETKSVIFKTSHFSLYAVGYSEASFKDVKGWAEEYIYYLADRGIISGRGNGIFAPDDNISRAEFVKILSGVAGADLSKYTQTNFADVKESDWFAPAVAWAAEFGVTKGVGGNNFAPNAKITREDMAVMILRFAEKMGYTLSERVQPAEFTDQKDIADYAEEAVSKMQKAGIISGKPNNLFDPKGSATRAEASKMIAVLLQIIR